jgi:cell division protein ZapA (FtsZ GTPase activity inhibitor)
MTEGRADVEILGQRLSVRGRGTPEYIHELADYLNGRIQAVRDQARVFDPLRLSLLAGLHVVDELYRCRETTVVRRADGELAARVERLSERLGAILDGGPKT